MPKKYGGLGLSQSNYGRAAVLLGSWDGNVDSACFRSPIDRGRATAAPFRHRRAKQKYLPRVAGGEISAFALTETHAGSDPATMSLRAEPSPDGSEFVLNGEKLWCTNGVKAGVLVVMARTPPKMVGGKERKQITAFIVDVDTPGLEIIYRCRFHGAARALQRSREVQRRASAARKHHIQGRRRIKSSAHDIEHGSTHDCLRRAWAFPNGCSRSRASGQANASNGACRSANMPRLPGKVAEMAGNVFAMEAMTFLTSSLVDRKAGDLRIETAMCKMWATETTWRIADDAMQVRGGRGYETAQSLAGRGEPPIAVERFLRDCRVNTIFEGSSEIMRLFIAREALDPHLKVGGAIFNTQLPMSDRAKAVFSSGKFYAGWYPRQWLMNGAGKIENLHVTLQGHVELRCAHEQTTRARLVSCHGAVRSETRP